MTCQAVIIIVFCGFCILGASSTSGKKLLNQHEGWLDAEAYQLVTKGQPSV